MKKYNSMKARKVNEDIGLSSLWKIYIYTEFEKKGSLHSIKNCSNVFESEGRRPCETPE